MTAGPIESSPKNGRIKPIPPDGGWGWVVVLGAFFIHVFADGFVYSFGVLVEIFKDPNEFNANNIEAGVVISLLTGLTLGSGPLASAICNRLGCRMTTIIGACISFVGCSLSYFATSIWHIAFTVGVVMGIGFGLMYCPAIVIVTTYFEKRRSLATGITVSGAGIGTMLFPYLITEILKRFEWRMVFVVFLFILVLCVLCGLTFRPVPFAIIPDDEEEEQEMQEINHKSAANHMQTIEEKDEKPEKTLEEAEAAKLSKDKTRALLELPHDKLFGRSISQSGDKQNGGASIRAARSMGHVGPGSDLENASRVRCSTIGEKDSGYLNRKDVFYTGSVTNVAEFRANPDKYRSTGSLHRGRHSTVGSGAHSRAHSLQKLDEVRETSEESNDTTTENVDGRDMKKTISKMLSLSLQLNPVFLLFAASNLLTSVGFNSPLYFLPEHARLGLNITDKDDRAAVMSSFGAFNTIGRIVFGMIADHRLPLPFGWGNDIERNRLWLYIISICICGIISIAFHVFDNLFLLCVYAGSFGFSIASYICLTSVILADLFGMERLTNAFGLLLLWQGIGTVFGPPVAGLLADHYKSYVPVFVFCGVNLLISGVMLFITPVWQKKYPLDKPKKLNETEVKLLQKE